MNISIKHSALFFLFIFTAYLLTGNVVKIKGYNSDVALQTACGNSIEVSSQNEQAQEVSSGAEVPLADELPVEPATCNASLQLLASSTNFFFDPGRSDQTVSVKTASVSSLIFVFQEPDPPRLI